MNNSKLTEREVQIMKCIWDADHQLALSEILQAVNDRFENDWKPTTASTFLNRLVQKGFLRLNRKVRYYSYEVLISQEEYLRNEAASFHRFWGKNAVKTFLSALFDGEVLGENEVNELKELFNAPADNQ